MRTCFALLLLLCLTASFAAPSGGAQEADTPTVVPEAETPDVARDVGVAELPLLVDEPPQEQEAPDIPDPVIGGEDSGFNPFAPLVLPQQPGETAPPAAPETPEAAEPEPAAPATETPPQPETAPAPAAPVFPAAPVPEARVGRPNLPNALAAGMTPPRAAAVTPAPGILEAAIGSPTQPLSDLTGTGIAVRTPSLPPLIAAPARVNRAPSETGQVGSSQGITPLTFAGTMLGDDENATSAASNRVSRALGDLRVSFTAMSTGTGIFRVGDSVRPILLVVGETLPGTRLTLSRLTARSAQFVEDDVRHTLLLNP